MIIAVCGNSGSGKSTLAIKIATMFAAHKKNTVLIDTDFISPQFNVWYPKKEMFNHSSLAPVTERLRKPQYFGPAVLAPTSKT